MQLESRIEARFQAFTHEVDLLREEIAQSVEGHGRNVKEWTRNKLVHVNAQLRGLRSFTEEVETFVRENVHLKKAEPQPGKLQLVKVVRK